MIEGVHRTTPYYKRSDKSLDKAQDESDRYTSSGEKDKEFLDF